MTDETEQRLLARIRALEASHESLAAASLAEAERLRHDVAAERRAGADRVERIRRVIVDAIPDAEQRSAARVAFAVVAVEDAETDPCAKQIAAALLASADMLREVRADLAALRECSDRARPL